MTDKIKTSDDAGNEVNDLLQKKDFGASFRPAREKLGLSQIEVAEHLLISIDVIKALENSQADALPALTFTQGYIRSYARMLNVPADEIINDYVQMAPDSKQVLTPHSVLQAQKSSNDLLIKTITVGFVILAVIVLGYWFYHTSFEMHSDSNNPVSELDVNIAKNHQYEAPVDEIIPVDETIIEPLLIKETTEVAEEKNNIIENSKTNLVTTEKTQTQKEAPVKDKLVLSALDDSWCEVQDSMNTRLYYQLLSKGEDITLSGVAPFVVFLGNAPKVRAEVNNKIVDFENLIRKNSNVVNLKIEKDAAVNLISSR